MAAKARPASLDFGVGPTLVAAPSKGRRHGGKRRPYKFEYRAKQAFAGGALVAQDGAPSGHALPSDAKRKRPRTFVRGLEGFSL